MNRQTEQKQSEQRPPGDSPGSETAESLSAYMGEISGIPLLTREQERRIGSLLERRARLDQLARGFLCNGQSENPRAAVAAGRLHWRIAREALCHLLSETSLIQALARNGGNPNPTLSELCRQDRGALLPLTWLDADRAQELADRLGKEPEDIQRRLAWAQLDCLLLSGRPVVALGEETTLLELDALLAENAEFEFRQLEECEKALRRRYQRMWQQGEDARDYMVRSNLRLVVSMARKNVTRTMPLQDLIQEGNLGLMQAVERFDHRRGHKFSTYAAWWIMQSINQALDDKSRLIRLPAHISSQIGRIMRTHAELNAEMAGEATIEEVAQALGLPRERVEATMTSAQPPISMDQPIQSEDELPLANTIRAPEESEPEKAATHRLLAQQLDAAMQTLTTRERQTLQLRFGLGGAPSHTIDETSRLLNVTRDEVRQAEKRAIVKLRNGERAKLLVDFLE